MVSITGLLPSDSQASSVELQRRRGARWARVGRIRTSGERRSFRFQTRVPSARTGSRIRYRVRLLPAPSEQGARTLTTSVVLVEEPRCAFWMESDVRPDGSFSATAALDRRLRARSSRLQVWQGSRWMELDNYDISARRRPGAEHSVDVGASSIGPSWYRVVCNTSSTRRSFATRPVRSRLQEEPEVIAHRAGGGEAPEGTVAAINHVMSSGVRVIEADVRLTADGVPVIFHDASLERTSDVVQVFPGRDNYALSSFTLSQLQSVSIGSWMGNQYAGERVLTLQQWLDLLDGRAAVQIEVKDPDARTAAVVSNALQSWSPTNQGQLTVTSFDLKWLQAFMTEEPGIRAGVLTGHRPTPSDLTSWATWAEEWAVPLAVVDRATVQAARALGLGTVIYTVNSTQELSAAIPLGADGLVTDYPRNLASLLRPSVPASAAFRG